MDFCVCCGQYVPEGRMVCPECEYKAEALAKEGSICQISPGEKEYGRTKSTDSSEKQRKC